MNKLSILALLLLVVAWKNDNVLDSPLISVIKLQSAEENLNLEEAKKYIDVDSVYSMFAEGGYSSAMDLWEAKVQLTSKMSQNKLVTNHFSYYKYDIIETVYGSRATVGFKSVESYTQMKEMRYSLENRNGKWVTTKIEVIRTPREMTEVK